MPDTGKPSFVRPRAKSIKLQVLPEYLINLSREAMAFTYEMMYLDDKAIPSKDAFIQAGMKLRQEVASIINFHLGKEVNPAKISNINVNIRSAAGYVTVECRYTHEPNEQNQVVISNYNFSLHGTNSCPVVMKLSKAGYSGEELMDLLDAI